jgi:hypothetical protein
VQQEQEQARPAPELVLAVLVLGPELTKVSIVPNVVCTLTSNLPSTAGTTGAGADNGGTGFRGRRFDCCGGLQLFLRLGYR